MNIIKYKHRFNPENLEQLNPDEIDSIALHHMEHSTASIDDVTGWHMDENKWSWIGYGYWIGFDGTIYECRGTTYLNAAVKDNNSHIISIGFQGDYSINKLMPTAQLIAGVELVKFLKTKLPKVKVVAGHNYWTNTKCPGEFFPLTEIVRKSEEKEMFRDADKISEYARTSVDNLVKLGIIHGDTDGNFNPLAPITRQDIAVIVNNLLKVKSL